MNSVDGEVGRTSSGPEVQTRNGTMLESGVFHTPYNLTNTPMKIEPGCRKGQSWTSTSLKGRDPVSR